MDVVANKGASAADLGAGCSVQAYQPMVTEGNTTSRNYANVANTNNTIKYEYVEVDATAVNNCYKLPTSAKISYAIRLSFGEDEERRIFAPRFYNPGVWRIETPNIERYRNVTELLPGEGEEPLAKITIRTEQLMVKPDGSVRRRQVRSENDLLVTLRDADTQLFSNVTNEDIIKEIVNLGIGTIKRSPQRQ